MVILTLAECLGSNHFISVRLYRVIPKFGIINYIPKVI